MASVVEICNMALSHLGSQATISAISPPDGSAEADYCARFYDQARTELIEPGAWAFTLKRAELAATTLDSNDWAFKYAIPSDCERALRIIKAGALYDNDSADFTIEGDFIYTDEEDAVLLYVRDVGDTTKFSPSFTSALTYMLASYLAGPIIKGNEAIKVGDAMRNIAMQRADMAAAAMANASSTQNSYDIASIKSVRS